MGERTGAVIGFMGATPWAYGEYGRRAANTQVLRVADRRCLLFENFPGKP